MIKSKLFLVVGLFMLGLPAIFTVYLMLTENGENLGFGLLAIYGLGWPFVAVGLLLLLLSVVWGKKSTINIK